MFSMFHVIYQLCYNLLRQVDSYPQFTDKECEVQGSLNKLGKVIQTQQPDSEACILIS